MKRDQMDWLPGMAVAFGGMGLEALFFWYVVLPKAKDEARECAEKASRAYAQGLKDGASVLVAQVDRQVAQVDAQTAAQKQGSAVDAANDLIAGAAKP